MSKAMQIAALAVQTIPSADTAPEWIQLLPAGPQIHTIEGDSRGPFELADPEAVIAASFADQDEIPIDENHALEVVGKLGGPSPARGWITAMEARPDGIWGQVRWTDAGAALVSGRAYRKLSPVVRHTKAGRITRISSVALTNTPALAQLVSLFMENTEMDLMQKLAKMLGLDEDATEDAILAKVRGMMGDAKDETSEAMAAQIAEIGTALGVQGGDAAAILAAAKAARTSDQGEVVTALRAELSEVATQLNALKDTSSRTAAETAIDAAIKRGVVGVKPLRDHYIARFMVDPDAVRTELAGLPAIGAGGQITPQAQPSKDGKAILTAEQRHVAKLLGKTEEEYSATLAAERAEHEEAL